MEQLEKPMSKEDIRTALYSMQNAKAPGPDGFTLEFFKNLEISYCQSYCQFLRSPLLKANLHQPFVRLLFLFY